MRNGENKLNPDMPQISRFYGIIIYLYFQDHNPHFHAWYGEYKCQINILDLSILAGRLPNRDFALVLEWATMHRQELLDNWNLGKKRIPFNSIEPLP